MNGFLEVELVSILSNTWSTVTDNGDVVTSRKELPTADLVFIIEGLELVPLTVGIIPKTIAGKILKNAM